ncbi:MAG: hypothetical protein NTZ90_15125 [Proteobacteria bacterium]|nr:hypothetical protein [Pseudomonadota bacterium]
MNQIQCLWVPLVAVLSLGLSSCTGSSPKAIQVDKQQVANGNTGDSADGKDGYDPSAKTPYRSSDSDPRDRSGAPTGSGDGSPSDGTKTTDNHKGSPAVDPGAPARKDSATGLGAGSVPGQSGSAVTLDAAKAKDLIGTWSGTTDTVQSSSRWLINPAPNSPVDNSKGTTADASTTQGATNAHGT